MPHNAPIAIAPKTCSDSADLPRINESEIHIDFMIGSDEVAVSGVTRGGDEIPLLVGGDWQI